MAKASLGNEIAARAVDLDKVRKTRQGLYVPPIRAGNPLGSTTHLSPDVQELIRQAHAKRAQADAWRRVKVSSPAPTSIFSGDPIGGAIEAGVTIGSATLAAARGVSEAISHMIQPQVFSDLNVKPGPEGERLSHFRRGQKAYEDRVAKSTILPVTPSGKRAVAGIGAVVEPVANKIADVWNQTVTPGLVDRLGESEGKAASFMLGMGVLTISDVAGVTRFRALAKAKGLTVDQLGTAWSKHVKGAISEMQQSGKYPDMTQWMWTEVERAMFSPDTIARVKNSPLGSVVDDVADGAAAAYEAGTTTGRAEPLLDQLAGAGLPKIPDEPLPKIAPAAKTGEKVGGEVADIPTVKQDIHGDGKWYPVDKSGEWSKTGYASRKKALEGSTGMTAHTIQSSPKSKPFDVLSDGENYYLVGSGTGMPGPEGQRIYNIREFWDAIPEAAIDGQHNPFALRKGAEAYEAEIRRYHENPEQFRRENQGDPFYELLLKQKPKGEVIPLKAGEKVGGAVKAKPNQLDKIKTGEPVAIDYVHNKDSALQLFGKATEDSPYGRWHEPAGRYVTHVDDASKATLSDTMISGTVEFKNPLVVPNDGLQWKKSLSDKYGGKRGAELSQALIDDGYDAVITTENGHTSEILDLTTFDPLRKTREKVGGAFPDAVASTKGEPVKAVNERRAAAKSNPIEVFHSTNADFTEFDQGKSIGGQMWFTSSKDMAEAGFDGAQSGRVVKAQIDIRNPAGWDEYDKFGTD